MTDDGRDRPGEDAEPIEEERRAERNRHEPGSSDDRDRELRHPDPMAPGTSVDDDRWGAAGGDAVEPNEPA